MTTEILKLSPGGVRWAAWAEAPPRLWWAVAMTAIFVLSLIKGGAALSISLGDADDAARLLQVREFIAGAPWFDTSTLRMGGPEGMLSHWSRLIDLPIAGLILTLNVIMPVEAAEFIVRALWPLIVLAPLVWVMIATAHGKGGSPAAAIVVLLPLLCPLGLYQFAAGRVDHHNVMIAATVAAALSIFSKPADLRAWRMAGGLCALALAIGYEALAPVALIAGLAAGWGFLDRGAAPLARGFTLVFITVFAALFVATIAPSRWMDIRCDAISLNMVLLAAAGCGGLIAALGRGATWPLALRIAVLAAAGVVGGLAYGAVEPKCLAGPMGQLPPELKTVWLQFVAESRSIARDLVKGDLEQSLGLIAFFSTGVAASAVRARASKAPADIFLLFVTAGFAVLACWQYKYVSYASMISILPLALLVARLDSVGDLSAAIVRFGAAVFISQAVLLAVSENVHAVAGAKSAGAQAARTSAEACSETATIRDLIGIAPGRIAAHIDMGAFIPALTPHNALSAPYHRIPDAIMANDRILQSQDDGEAQTLLARNKVDYIVLCDGLDAAYAASSQGRDTIRGRLLNGRAPSYLTPVPLSNPTSILHVWKVDAAALSLQP